MSEMKNTQELGVRINESEASMDAFICPPEGRRACIVEFDVGRKVRTIEIIILEQGCWLVTSHTAKNAQGKNVIYRKNKSHLISRYLYELKNGPIYKEWILVQTCDTPGCCAPEHHEQVDRGYFNTLEYMFKHNPEHHFNLCMASKTRKGRRRRRLDYGRVFSNLIRQFPNIEQELPDILKQGSFPSSQKETVSDERSRGETKPNQIRSDNENLS